MTEKVTILKKILLDNKYLNPTTDPNEIKLFHLRFLTAADWSKDNLSNTLVKIDTLCAERNDMLKVDN